MSVQYHNRRALAQAVLDAQTLSNDKLPSFITVPTVSDLPLASDFVGMCHVLESNTLHSSDGVTWTIVGSLRTTTTPGGEGVEIINGGHALIDDETSDIIAPAHIVGNMGWISVDTTAGQQLDYLVCNEGKFELFNGTVGAATVGENQLAENADQLGLLSLSNNQILNNSGNIDAAVVNSINVSNNTGTIGVLYANHFPDMSAVTGIGVKRSFLCQDPNAPSVNAALSVNQAIGAYAPASGDTVSIPNNQQDVLIVPAGTLASLTIVFPPNPINGQELSVKTTAAITSLTLDTGGRGNTDPITTLAALGYFTYKYLEVSNLWYRKG